MMNRANCFVTLTYRDEDLPDALVYSHFQKFMKRLRKSQPDVKLRYFVAGEYGDRTHRPHWHMLLFGADYRFGEGARKYNSSLYESSIIDDTWRMGRALIGELNAQSAAYVAQYAMKKIDGLDVDKETGFLREPMVRMSKGIGESWFEKFGASDLRHDYAILDDYNVPVPRYYRERLHAQDPLKQEERDYQRYLKAQRLSVSRERLEVLEQVAHAKRDHYSKEREI